MIFGVVGHMDGAKMKNLRNKSDMTQFLVRIIFFGLQQPALPSVCQACITLSRRLQLIWHLSVTLPRLV